MHLWIWKALNHVHTSNKKNHFTLLVQHSKCYTQATSEKCSGGKPSLPHILPRAETKWTLYAPGGNRLRFILEKQIDIWYNTHLSPFQSLCELVGEISNMVISDEVGGWVWGAVEEWRECSSAAREGRLQEATFYCGRSFTQADAAFFHPSLLALLYFPDNQKYMFKIIILSSLNLVLLSRLLSKDADRLYHSFSIHLSSFKLSEKFRLEKWVKYTLSLNLLNVYNNFYRMKIFWVIG